MNIKTKDQSYTILLQSLKTEIRQARIRAHLSVNKEMISLYWKIGNQILTKQQVEGWGAKVIENISKDLRQEFPEMKGLSSRNLVYMQTFAKAYPDFTITQEALAQITWYHNITLLEKVEKYEERLWYVIKQQIYIIDLFFKFYLILIADKSEPLPQF